MGLHSVGLVGVPGHQWLCTVLWGLAGTCSQTLHGFLLQLPGLVVKQDSHCHQDGPNGGQASDVVAKHNDAQPDGQGVLHGAGHAATRGHEDAECPWGCATEGTGGDCHKGPQLEGACEPGWGKAPADPAPAITHLKVTGEILPMRA